MAWKNFQLSHEMFLGFGVITLLILSVLGYTYMNFTRPGQVVDINLHTYNVIREADAVEKSLLNMETGARGFVIAGKDEFLEPFRQGKVDYELHYKAIKELTADNSSQQVRLDNLQKSYESWLEWETVKILSARQKINEGQAGIEEVIAEIQKGEGKKYMEDIRLLLSDITKEEQRLLVMLEYQLRIKI